MSRATCRACVAAGGLLGGIAVAAGAFGAHGLKSVLESSGQAANWETASRYALAHALALVVTGLAAALPGTPPPARTLAAAGGCFGVGTLVFSGCLWALALTGVRLLGAIVPVGGVLLIAGWALLALGGRRLGAEPRSADLH